MRTLEATLWWQIESSDRLIFAARTSCFVEKNDRIRKPILEKRRRMTCAENPPPSLLKQDGLCTQDLYCRNQSWEIETGGGVCENVSASWFDTLKKKGWKKLPLDWKMEIDVECWLFFFYVHPYARMGTLRRSNTKAKTEETHAGEGAPEFS